ncbi:YceH family protein [Mesorhizobium sp. IMUNJ 23232]|uniref:YceH family protein n=1 Tax=Mesorhizobium sp. IMUNJ 23232 TaxID=3376064 RepID=UPI00379F9468
MSSDLPTLNALEVRVLGCLMEKQLLTPDVYPLTLNALQSAANQKTSREPVMALEHVDINRTLKALEEKGLARRMMASRVDRYEQTASRKFSLTTPQSALVAMLMLRGPQTLNELQTRTDRMANFGSADAVRTELDMLVGRRPPLVKEIGRAPGQREDRFAHLLAGDVDVSSIPAPAARSAAPAGSALSELEERVRQLEEEVAALKARLEAVGA